MAYLVRALIALFLLFASANAVFAKPNIVVILTDDQEDTGSMAYMPKVHSLLAERGLTFTNSFVNFSLCAPSRASFLTGQAAHNHGVISNEAIRSGGWQAFKSKEGNALPDWLKAAGYRTALIGKYINESGAGADRGAPPTWMPPGWDLWFSFAGGDGYYDYQINDNGTIRKFDLTESDYSTDVLKERATQFIADQADAKEPFFMLIAPRAPHAPSTSAPGHATLFADVIMPRTPAFNEDDVSDKPAWIREAPSLDASATARLDNNYRSELQSLQAVDDLVEAVCTALQKAGKWDDTYIIFTSDNGMIYGDHRRIGKILPYEGSIRVPLVVRGPGIPANQSRTELINNLDVVATVEELAGVEPELIADGRSLTPLFADAKAPWRSAILFEGSELGARPTSWLNYFRGLMGHERSKKSQKDDGREFTAVRTANRKYVRGGDGFEELYDLVADPYELENKAADPAYASDLATLRETLDLLKSCAGASCWVP